MEFPYHSITKNAGQTSSLGQTLAWEIIKHQGEGRAEQAVIVCLYGELGSGKTTFTQGFSRSFGLTQRFLSPTFIIVRRYQIPQSIRPFYHVDLYRISSEKDIEEVGLPEIMSDNTAIILIEWADRLGSFIPKRRIDIHFMVNKSGHHDINIAFT